jgi:hypothetical protein
MMEKGLTELVRLRGKDKGAVSVSRMPVKGKSTARVFEPLVRRGQSWPIGNSKEPVEG